MSKADYYEILGVSRNATAEDLKKGYRKTALKYHPDRNPDDPQAEDKFKEAAEAYEMLSNTEKRSQYDRFGHEGVNHGGFSGGRRANVDDIFRDFGDIFGGNSPFGSFFGREESTQGSHIRGTDLRIRLKLTLEEIAHGIDKHIKVKRMVKDPRANFSRCNTCQGSGEVSKYVQTLLGRMVSSGRCPQCGGTGQKMQDSPQGVEKSGLLQKEETLSIPIPAGVSEGIQLSMSGKGNEAPGGIGRPGDLLIIIEEVPHLKFERENNNICLHLGISMTDAIFGKECTVPTISGQVKIKIQPGTQGGKVLRLRNKGIQDLESRGIGDQLIYIHVWIPKSVSAEEHKILDQLSQSANFQPPKDIKYTTS